MKRIITILASLALIFSITACTNEQKQNVIENSSVVNSEEKARSNISTKTNDQQIIFPANDNDKTEYNASIYEIEPFTLTIEFPEGWTVKEQQATKSSLSYLYSGVWSVMDIFNDKNECVGSVGYNTYDEEDGAEEVPQAIYNQIALGNGYKFDAQTKDNDDAYTPIVTTDTGCTAITDVLYSESFMAGLGLESKEKVNKGILSYNKDLLVYIAMEFDKDLVSDELLNSIAESVALSR